MRAPASDNTLRVEHESASGEISARRKKATTPPAPASPQRPSRARASLWHAADKLAYRSHSARAFSHALLRFFVAAGHQTPATTTTRGRRENDAL